MFDKKIMHDGACVCADEYSQLSWIHIQYIINTTLRMAFNSIHFHDQCRRLMQAMDTPNDKNERKVSSLTKSNLHASPLRYFLINTINYKIGGNSRKKVTLIT